MGVGLHALARIEDRPVAVEEIPDYAERDVGVVAKPRIGEKDIGEDSDEKSKREPGELGLATRSSERIGTRHERVGERHYLLAEGKSPSANTLSVSSLQIAMPNPFCDVAAARGLPALPG
jgi:hypothetical protein